MSSNFKLGRGGNLYDKTTGQWVGLLDEDGGELLTAIPSDQGIGIIGPDGKPLSTINANPRPAGTCVFSARSPSLLGVQTGARAPQSVSFSADGVRLVAPLNTDNSTNDYTIITLPSIRTSAAMPRSIAIRMYSPDWTKVARFIYYVGTTAYAKFYTKEFNAGSPSTRYAPGLTGSGWRTFWLNADDYVANAGVAMTDIAAVHKIHLYSKLGAAADITFARENTIVYGAADVSSISIISDDGYKTWYDNASPILAARNLRAGIAVIPDRVGYSAEFMTWEEMRAWVAAGNYCHTHGCRNGLDNLSLYPSVADAVADAVWSRAQIRAQGCAVDGAENVYIFPQGRYYFDNDVYRRDLTDALLAEGFTVGRCIWNPQTFHTRHFNDTASRMILPIMGYGWSSTDEAGNVAAIRARIASCGQYGYSGTLMFHKLVTTPATGIECAITTFTQFMDDVEAQVLTYGAKNVGMQRQIDDLVYA